MKVLVKSITVLLILLTIWGCATIVSKSIYPVNINSNPEGATIIIKNKTGTVVYQGKTPTTVSLQAGAGFFQGENYTVEFSKEGYGPQTAQIKRGVDGWYIFGNIFIGGLLGWLIIDPATGAMWTLEPNVFANLSAGTADSGKENLNILTIAQVPENLRDKLIRLK
jgi:hypothetical protein